MSWHTFDFDFDFDFECKHLIHYGNYKSADMYVCMYTKFWDRCLLLSTSGYGGCLNLTSIMLFIVAAGAKPAIQTNNNSPPVHSYVSVQMQVGMYINTYIHTCVCTCLLGPSNQLLTNCCATFSYSFYIKNSKYVVDTWYAIGGLSAFGFFFISQRPSEAFLYLTVLK